jgi:hypothetical protein
MYITRINKEFLALQTKEDCDDIDRPTLGVILIQTIKWSCTLQDLYKYQYLYYAACSLV